MRVKLNQVFVDPETVQHGYNRFYKRFRKAFEALLLEGSIGVLRGEPDAAYVPMHRLENEIIEAVDTVVDSVRYLVGYTGIGKSTVVRHVFSTSGNVEIKNACLLLPVFFDNRWNLERTVLRLLAAAVDTLQRQYQLQPTPHEIGTFIYNTRKDLLFWNSDICITLPPAALLKHLQDAYPEAYYIQTLKYLLRHTPVRRVIVILDDIESQPFDAIENIIRRIHANHTCLCNDPGRTHVVNCLICLRPGTKRLLETRRWLTAYYQSREDIVFDEVVSLAELFASRFAYYVEERQLFDQAVNKASWGDAYEMLLMIVDKVATASEHQLVRLCNCNVRLALRSLTRIVTNKRWFEKSNIQHANPPISSDYDFTEAGLYRALSLGNRRIFDGIDVPIKNIFYNTASHQSDLLVCYVMRALESLGKRNDEYRTGTKDFLIRAFTTMFPTIEGLGKHVEQALRILVDLELAEETETPGDNYVHFALLPRAMATYKALQESSFLLELFRDDTFLEYSNFKLRQSATSLRGIELTSAIMDMLFQVCCAEERLVTAASNAGKLQTFRELFGEPMDLVSAHCYNGMQYSVKAYFSFLEEVPSEVRQQLVGLRRKVEAIQDIF